MILSAYIAEAVGTAILVFFGNGVVASTILKKSKGDGGGWIAIVLGWGIAVMLAIYAVARFSDAHINPAVTLALASHNLFPWDQVPGYIIGQLSGSAIGALLVYLFYFPHLQSTKNPERKLACFATMPAIHAPIFNLISEILATAMLVLGAMALAANADWLHTAMPTTQMASVGFHEFFLRGIRPLLVGILIIGLGLSFGGTTGFALNPARDLMPRILHSILPLQNKGCSGWHYAWVPVLGPIVGAYLGLSLHIYLTHWMH